MATRNSRGQFVPGHPGGKPKGSKSKITIFREMLGDAKCKKIRQKAYDMAMAGDATCIKLLMDRIDPPSKSPLVTFPIPAELTAENLPMLSASVIAAVASGQISADIAAKIGGLINAHALSLEVNDQQTQLDRLSKIVDVTPKGGKPYE